MFEDALEFMLSTDGLIHGVYIIQIYRMANLVIFKN